MNERASESNGKYINSIIRASNILNLYRTLGVPALGISEIGRHLQMDKTTVFRVVKTLEAIGWLVQEENDSRYRIGPMLLLLSSVPTRSTAADDAIQQEMRRLRTLFNEDVVLTTLVEGNIAVCIEKMKSNNALKIASNVGHVIDMTRGASGKTLFAYLGPEEREAVIRRDRPNLSQEERRRLEASLADIREKGYGVSTGEKDEGVTAVAVPILGKERTILHTLSIVGEANRMQKKGIRKMAGELLRTADYLENVLRAF